VLTSFHFFSGIGPGLITYGFLVTGLRRRLVQATRLPSRFIISYYFFSARSLTYAFS